MAQSNGLIGESANSLGSAPEGLSDTWRKVPRLTKDALRVGWLASRRELIGTLVLQAGAGFSMTIQLLAAQRALQALLVINEPGVSGSSVIPPFAVLIGAMIANGAFTALAEQRQRLLGELVAQHSFAQIVGVSTRVELAAFEDSVFHDHLERARASATTRAIQMIGAVSGLSLAVLTSVGIAVALFVLQPLLLPLVVVSSVPMLMATIHNSRHAYTFEWAMTPENRERAYLIELLTRREAAKEIRVFGATNFLRSRYEVLTSERLSRVREFLRQRLGVALAGSVATSTGMGLALAALALMISSGRIGVSTAMAAGAAMQQLSSRLFGMMASLGQLVESGMFVDDYNSFLKILPEGTEEAEEAEEEEEATSASERSGGARFNGLQVTELSFRYPNTERLVIDDVSLRVDPGEVVALVGENGSGKTTLVKLICQLYKPFAGDIRWNGIRGEEIPPEAVRDDITVVFQDFLQYHLTATENIALGRVERDPSPEAVRAAAEHAGADRFVERLPSGYETRLGRQFIEGQELSIGQWQRLALARAFFRGGGFLVLDEPTASLDPRAEYELFQRMRQLWQGRSVLLVSHRFSSVRSADRIYVLRDGRMIEDGDHSSLMARDGHYADLFTMQASAYLERSGSTPWAEDRKNPDTVGVSQP